MQIDMAQLLQFLRYWIARPDPRGVAPALLAAVPLPEEG